MRGRVLAIAGSDSGGGAGIQADLKAITALGGFGMTAITALTAQNTLGVTGVHRVPPAFVAQQIDAVRADLGVDCYKIGMLADSEIVEAVAAALSSGDAPVVLDPVMLATSGAALLSSDGVAALRQSLFPVAHLLTPNLPEAERLANLEIRTVDDMRRAADRLLGMGPAAVVIKGGHMEGAVLVDLLVTQSGEKIWQDARIATRSTHGTGCTLASAIATGIAQGLDLVEAVERARRYLREAILRAPGYGAGAGPIDHCVTVADSWRQCAV